MKSLPRNFRALAVLVFIFTLTVSFQGCGDINGLFGERMKSSPGNGQGYEGYKIGDSQNMYASAELYIFAGSCTDGSAESIIQVVSQGNVWLVRDNCEDLNPAIHLPAGEVAIDGAVLFYNGNGYLKP